MTTISFDLDTNLPPDRVIAALTDFSARRRDLFPSLDPASYRVNAQGDGWADVTEGRTMAGGIWERNRYEWTEPHTVRMKLINSNLFRPGSDWLYRVEPRGSGSHVHFEVVRLPLSTKAR